MGKNLSYTTSNGAQLSEADVKQIQKDSQKETVKTVLAVIGAGALVYGLKTWLDARQIPDKSE